MKIFISVIILLMTTQQVSAGIFNAEHMTLDNGLEVVVIPNHRAPIVNHMLWYKVGAAQELEGHSGVAHFLEHLLFKGTDHPTRPLKPGEFSQKIKKLGGNDNAFTSKDYTAFYQTVSKEHLNTVMQMEADRIGHAMPPEEHVLSERNVVIEERNQRTDNNPQARFFEKLRKALFPNHQYGRPVIGWPDEIKVMNHHDTKSFYDNWYHVNNAILIISGDVTLDEIKDDITRIYGDIPSKEVPNKSFPITQISGDNSSLIHHDEQVKQPLFIRAYIAPSFKQSKEESLALQILENILDGGATTRLYKKLVVEDKKAISISLSYTADQLDTSSIWITATPADNISLEELRQNIDNLFADIIKNGLTEKEILESKKRMRHAAIFARDSLSSPAHIIGRALTTGSSLDDVENWDKQIDSVTKEQIASVLNKYFSADNTQYVTGHLLPVEKGDQE